MYIYIHVYIYTYEYIYINIYVYVYIHIFLMLCYLVGFPLQCVVEERGAPTLVKVTLWSLMLLQVILQVRV